MRFAHISDLHLGKRVNGFSMLEDQRHILNEIADVLKTQGVQALLIAGDVYDKSQPPAEAVSLFDDFLCCVNDLGVKTFIISGNHDSAQRLAFGASLFRKSNVFFSPVFEGEMLKVELNDEYGSIFVYLLPYIRPFMVRNAYDEEEILDFEAAVKAVIRHQKIDYEARNIVVAHQFITGARLSESEEMSVGGMENISSEAFGEFDYAALGHIHGAQDVVKGKVRYCGTPLKYSFSEVDHKKSVTIIDLKQKGEPAEIKEVFLKPLRDLRQIRGEYKDIVFAAQQQQGEDYMHIILTDEIEIPDAARKLLIYYPNLMKLTYDNKRTRKAREILPCDEEKTQIELFKDFYKSITNCVMSEAQERYIAGIIDDLKGGTA